jgi:hypothetical protein
MTFSETEIRELTKSLRNSPESPVDNKRQAESPKPMDDPEIQKQIDEEVKTRVEAEVQEILKNQEKIQAAVKARTKEVEEILLYADKFGRRQDAYRFIEENKTLADFTKFILDRQPGFQPLQTMPAPDTKMMKRKVFDSMTVGERMSFLKSGGKLIE